MNLSTPPDAPGAVMATPRFKAWEVTLDRIELDVIRTEKALDEGLGLERPLDEWHVPDDYGPIPAALRPRAEEILARQQVAMRRIAEQLGVNAAHQVYVGADRATPHATGPVYVDTRF
jgi:hypothetical protein